MAQHRSERVNFTLTELIVVVAIMAALIAFLLPSLHDARRKAIRTLCVANQFQLGVGVANYATTFDDILVPAEYPEENWLRRQNGEELVFSGSGDVNGAQIDYGTNSGRNSWGTMYGEVGGSIPFNPNNSTGERNWEFTLTYIDDDTGETETIVIGRDTVIEDLHGRVTGTAVEIVVRPMRNDDDYTLTVGGVPMDTSVQGFVITGEVDFDLAITGGGNGGGKGGGKGGGQTGDWLLNLNGGNASIEWGTPPGYAAPFPWWGLATYYGGHTIVYDMTFHTRQDMEFYHCPAGYDVDRGGYSINGYASNYTRDPWTREYGAAYSQILSIAEPAQTALIMDDTYSSDSFASPPFGGVMGDNITYRWAGRDPWRSTIHGSGVFVNGVITYVDGHTEVRNRPYYAETEKVWAGIYAANREDTGKLYIMPF